MRKLTNYLFAAAAVLILVSCAATKTATKAPSAETASRATQNVILMIPDGNSTSLLALARWYKQLNGEEAVLAVDEGMCGLVRSYLSDSPIVASSGAMSAYMTGQRTTANMMSTYPASHPGHDMEALDPAMAYHPLMTVVEAAKVDRGKATGLVFTVEFPHATPGATSGHSHDRNDYPSLGMQMASLGHDVVFGGGIKYVTPELKKVLEDKGITYIEGDLDAFRNYQSTDKVWALMAKKSIEYEIDRNNDEQPSLSEMTAKAIDILSQKKEGFFLMVEGSKVDYAAHANDPVTCIREYLEFDKSVQVAIDFAKKNGNTTVVVLPDHGCAGIGLGNNEYHGYYRRGIQDAFEGTSAIKCSAEVLARKIREAGPEHAKELFKEWVGMEITDEEENTIYRYLDKTVANHMEVAGSLQYELQWIMSKRLHFSYSSGNHTIEDVFLSIYSPSGDRLEGVHSNTELNAYLCEVAGLTNSLSYFTDKYFHEASEVFEGCEVSESNDCGYPVMNVKKGNNTLEVHANRSFVILNGKRVELPIASVYMLKNSKFYVAKELRDMLQ